MEITKQKGKELFTLVERINNIWDEPPFTDLKEATGVFVAFGGRVERRYYTESEYAEIRAEADRHIITGYEYSNGYDYEHGGEEGRSTVPHKSREITDAEILVKDGKFYGVLLVCEKRRDDRLRQQYYGIATVEEKDGINVFANYNYSEWGNTMSSTRARLEKREQK